MTPSDLLHRMEEAQRQTQRQLDIIDRQITRRMTALIPSLGRKQSGYRRGKPPDPGAFLTAERQPEIDALARKFARQVHAIEALRQRLGIEDGRSSARHERIDTTMHHHDAGPASALWPETSSSISR